jgi:hypothetical protein
VLEEETPGVSTYDEADDDEETYNPDTWTPSVQKVDVMRPRKGQGCSHLHATTVQHAMMQYYLKKGLKKFKKVGKEAVSTEVLQLNMRDTFKPQSSDELGSDQKKGALESIMFLKEKHDGSIKGWTFVDG